MWRLLIVLTAIAAAADDWLSGGDKSSLSVLSLNKLPVTRGLSASGIEVLYDLSNPFTPPTGIYSNLVLGLQDAASKAATFLKNSLTVFPVTNLITVSPSSPELDCGNGIGIQQKPYTTRADFIAIVRSYNDPASSRTGFSQVCHLQQNDRNAPLVAVISINKAKFETLSVHKKWTFVAHLTILALGFADKLTPYWRDSSGSAYLLSFSSTKCKRN